MRVNLLIILSITLFSCSSKNKESKKEINIIQSDSLSILSEDISRSNKVVFGIHPYWANKNKKNYNHDVLTALAYFDYALDPTTGGYRDIRDWENSPVIDDALSSGSEVYLTVTNFTRYKNQSFLKNLQACRTSIDSIDILLKRRKAHGVVINFEDVSKDLETYFTNYIKDLSKHLKASDKKLAIVLPGNISVAFDIKKLNNHVDFFIVMGKNYFYKIGEPAGPVAPLNENKKYNKKGLRTSIQEYLKAGVPHEKFVLTLPFYGFEWVTETDSLYSKSVALNELTYDDIKKKYRSVNFKYDSISQSAYYKYTNTHGEHIQVWYDDAKTLEKKLNLINTYDLAGVCIWALSFASNDDELWQLIYYKFNE